MYIISKLFTYIFLPPGIFVIILFLAGFYSKKLKSLFFSSALLLWALSSDYVSDALLYPLEYNYTEDNTIPKAVVVLGGGANPNDILKTSPEAFKREIYAVILSKKHNLPFIFSGGGLNIPEAECVKKDLDLLKKNFNLNIKTYFENRSLNTYQNAKYTSELFTKLKIPKKIYLVTSAYHMKRSLILFKKFGFETVPEPVGYYYKGRYNVWSIFPKMGNLYRSYKALHEYFGILSLKLGQI
jgi:uncharacterized SAM-binding protein YcdF (DUF218 family)